MSTIDQAFVQAFARRNRRPSTATTPIAPKERTSESRAVESAEESSVEKIAVEKSTVEKSTVEKSAVHWIDPAKDSLLRAEAASAPSVPPPHNQIATNGQTATSGQLPNLDPADTALPTEKQTGLATESPSRFVNEQTFLQNALGTSETSALTDSIDSAATPTNAEAPYISASSRKDVAFKSKTLEPTLLQANQLDRTVTTSRDEIESFAAEARVADSPVVVEQAAETVTSPDTPPAPGPVNLQRIDAADPFVNAPHHGSKIGPTSAPVKASWEVDVFDVPSSVMDLFFQDELFQTVAQRLHIAVSEGLSSMMVTSSKPGEGRSTVAIGMAVAAAATGIRVALVDGDIDEPTLVDDLRLDVDHGWRDALHSGMPLSQVAVYSIEDNLTLIPLVPQTVESRSARQDLTQMVQSLVQQFDLIIIDAGNGNGETIDQLATLVDSAVIARDASRTDAATIDELSSRLRSHGLQGIGIVENFA